MILDRSESRDGYAVRVLAVHTTEGTSYTAEELRDADWWTGSSHAIADDDVLLTQDQGCVPYDMASWTLRSGNRWSENIELVAMAAWTRAQWLARPKLLDNCARWLADRSKARGIPLVKLTPSQYRAGGSGVIGHHDHTVGYSDGTHWDPGPNFPWDVVLELARTGSTVEDDMTPDQAKQLLRIEKVLMRKSKGGVEDNHLLGKAAIARLDNLAAAMTRSEAREAALVEAVTQLSASLGGDVDTAAIVAAADRAAEAAVDRLVERLAASDASGA